MSRSTVVGVELPVILEVSQQVAERVADLAIGFRHLLDSALADADVVGVVHAGDVEPQYVGAILVGHLVGGDVVALGLGDLSALVVDHETVGQNRLERRGAGGPDRRQDRRLEPAAVLIRALQVHEGGIAQVEILRQNAAMAGARLEPDVEDVSLLAERRPAALGADGAGRNQLLDRPGEPDVGSFGCETGRGNGGRSRP